LVKKNPKYAFRHLMFIESIILKTFVPLGTKYFIPKGIIDHFSRFSINILSLKGYIIFYEISDSSIIFLTKQH